MTFGDFVIAFRKLRRQGIKAAVPDNHEFWIQVKLGTAYASMARSSGCDIDAGFASAMVDTATEALRQAVLPRVEAIKRCRRRRRAVAAA